MHPKDPIEPSPGQRTGAERDEAMARWAVLRPHLNDGVPLSQTAREAGVPLRSAQRWLARYRAEGWAGLTRAARSDRGHRKLPAEWVEVIEGLALCKPPPSVASIHRRVTTLAVAQKSAPPSYSSVYQVVRSLNPALVVLAHEGEAAFRSRFELIHRHRPSGPMRSGRPTTPNWTS